MLGVFDTGHIELVLPDGSSQRVGITRAHLEEDAGAALAASSFQPPASTRHCHSPRSACSGAVSLSELAAHAHRQLELLSVNQQAQTPPISSSQHLQHAGTPTPTRSLQPCLKTLNPYNLCRQAHARGQ
jgi:hypothetical protein